MGVGVRARFELVQTFVDVDHEGVEMHASFVGYVGWEGAIEEVHEHRFAGADVAVEVETGWGIGIADFCSKIGGWGGGGGGGGEEAGELVRWQY